jgi:hypothetical protein
MRDLVALSALPALWAGCRPLQVARTAEGPTPADQARDWPGCGSC